MTEPDPTLPVDERLRLLEAHVGTQEEILAAMQAERIEAERLNDSVVRLGLGASDLGAALLQVDKTQQMLTKLGQDITRVEETTVSKDDMAANERLRLAKEKADRRDRANKITTWVVIGLAVLTLLILTALNRQSQREADQREYRQSIFDVCQQRYDQSLKLRKLAEPKPGRPPRTPEQEADAKLFLEAFPLVDCTKLHPDYEGLR